MGHDVTQDLQVPFFLCLSSLNLQRRQRHGEERRDEEEIFKKVPFNLA